MSSPTEPATPPLVLVYGATGGTGRQVVKNALEHGMRVRAFVRNASRLPGSVSAHKNVHVYTGDLTDTETVTAALEGVTYAICVAGGREISAELGMTKAVQAIILAMPRYGVTRFLYQAGALSPMPGQKLPVSLKIMRTVFGALLRGGRIMEDNDGALAALCESKDIRWVALRPGFIKTAPSNGKLKEAAQPHGSLAYVDLAEFILDAVQTDKYDKKGVYLSY